MEYESDDKKAALNLEEHGVAFEEVEAFEWDKALVAQDSRKDYGEARYTAIAPIEERVHVLVYTLRGEDSEIVRVISLRKANKREVRRYEQAQTEGE